ncbi:MAG: PAS domain-containing sensor histidine kinase, partial [Verrucomicrobiota bacterium]
MWEVFPDAVNRPTYQHFHQAMDEKVPIAFEQYILEKDAWYESRCLPTPEGLIVFFSDVTERKRAEEQLRQSEERFRLIMNEAKDYAILMLDPEGCVISWNDGAQRLKGYAEDEIIGEPFSRFYTPEDIEIGKPRKELDQAKAEGRVEYEGWRVRRDGSRYWADVVMTALHDKSGGLIGFSKLVRDASERRRVETERNRFISLAENSTEFIGMCDLSYKPFFVNRAGIRLVGLESVQQALAVEVKDFFFPEDQPFIYEQFFPEVLREGHAEKEIRFRHFKTGATLWVLYNVFTLTGPDGKSIGFATVSRDITERKRVEEALRHSEELHRVFFDLGAVGMAYASPEGRLLKVNDKYCDITGYSRSELEGFPVLELTHPDDRESDRAVYDAYIQGALQVYTSEKRYIRKDRSVRWVAVNARMVREADGRPRYSLGIIEDITERKRAEENLCHARDKLAQLNKELEQRVEERTALLEESLQSLEGVLYHVAHDLRAPLRAMHSFTDLLLDEYARTLDARGENYAQRIRDAAGRMDRLIQDLLNYGRLGHQVVVWASVDLTALVESVLKDLRHDILTTKAELQVDAPLPKVRGDAQILDQVLNNLMCNALKFVAPGVRPRIRIWAETFGSTVRLNIQDNGIGIAPDYHERIFRMFERLHEANSIYPGTGIGLAIVKKGIDRLAGRVGVESQV